MTLIFYAVIKRFNRYEGLKSNDFSGNPHRGVSKTNEYGKERRVSQHERIVAYIANFGSISPLEAFRDLGITKLATRISEMRKDGMQFDQKIETTKNRYGERVRYMRYFKGGALHE